MKQINVKKLIILILMLIAIINTVLIIRLFFNDIAREGYTITSIIVLVLQIIAIIISIIILIKHIDNKKENLLKIILIIILLITFFIPVQTDWERTESGSLLSVTPTVMPEELKQNLYNITIYR